MTDFVITTENAADLPEEFIQENEIGICRFTIPSTA